MPDVLVRAIAVSKVYGGGEPSVAAVTAATCEVLAEQRIALVGPSGSGKSTLLFLLAGIEEPTGGVIEWPGLGSREKLRPGPVAVAFQGQSLLPPLTVEENVALPLLLAGRPEDEATAAAREELERFGVSDVAGKLPEELSGGQAQRAGLARAVVGRPALLLVDEPTGEQDRLSAQRILDALFASVDGSAAALLIATHDPAVAERASGRWAIRDGRLDTGVAQRSS